MCRGGGLQAGDLNMNTTFFYALILAVSNIVLSLVSFFLGYQTDKMAEGKWFGWLTMVYPDSCIRVDLLA